MFEQPKISSLPTVLFTQCPLLPVLISLVAGIVLARYIQGSDLWWIAVALIFLSVASKLLKWPVLFMLLSGVPVGMLCEKADGYLHSSDVVYNPSQRVSCRGVVLNASDGTVNTRLLVDLDSPYSGICYLTVTGSAGFYAGDIVTFDACILPLSSRCDVDGDIDLNDFYYRYHVACRAVAVHGTLERVGEASGLRWSAIRQREHLIDRILDTQLSPPTQEFAVALLLGDDTLLDDSARRDFSRAGLAHLLALSGMHVAIFSLVISMIFYPIAFLGYRRVRWLLVIAVLWCYALLTGLSPSVVRAVTMFSIVLLGKCVGRRSTSGNALCLAAIVLLICSPRQLYAPGLQLSFIAVASLIAIPSLLPEVSITHRLLKWGYDYMVFTLAATTGTLLLAAYYFHTVPLFFLVTNIPIAFVLPVFMVGVLIVMVLSAAGVSFPFLDRGVDFVSDLIGKLAQTFGKLPVSAIDDVYIPAWGLLAGYLGITLILLSLYYRPKLRLAVAGLVSLLLLAMSGLISRPDEEKLFIGRSSDATNIIYTDRGVGHLLTTARESNRDRQIDEVKTRYSAFWGIRGIDNLVLERHLSNPQVDCMLSFGEYKIAIINSNHAKTDTLPQFDYMIVGLGFTGDILELTGCVKADSILLGTDINGKRRHRFYKELHESGYNVRSLEDDYGLVLTSSPR